MVLARAMERRVWRKVAVLLSCCVAFCIRRPKWAFCSDLISCSKPATSFCRNSSDFIVGSLLTQHTGNKRGAQRQLGRGQGKRLARKLLGHARDFVQHFTWLNFCHVKLDVALAVAHTNLSWLLCDWLVGKHTNPNTPTTLNVTRNGATRGLDLAGG